MTEQALYSPEQFSPLITNEQLLIGESATEPELGEKAKLVGYNVEISPQILEAAWNELDLARQRGISTFTPAFQEGIFEDFPASIDLSRELFTKLLTPSGTDLSFIRGMGAAPELFVGNLHHDYKYVGFNEQTGQRESVLRPTDDSEIWRQVINLGPHPRFVQIVDRSMASLEQAGVATEEIRPKSILLNDTNLGEQFDSKTVVPACITDSSSIIAIPPYDGQTMYVLEFWSSRVLHAGITDTAGHFMAAAAKWAPVPRPQ